MILRRIFCFKRNEKEVISDGMVYNRHASVLVVLDLFVVYDYRVKIAKEKNFDFYWYLVLLTAPITLLAYAIGFIFWNFYLGEFGFFEYNLIQLRFLSAGALFVVILTRIPHGGPQLRQAPQKIG